jgi:RNA polymerase sigma factor (sigma-70 family)
MRTRSRFRNPLHSIAGFYEVNARRYLAQRPTLAYVDIVARRARAGDREALCELCELLAGIAESLSGKYVPVAVRRGLTRDDLRQEAMCAVLAALASWRPEKSAFRSYAFGRARFALLNYLNRAHLVSVPKSAGFNARDAGQPMRSSTRQAAFAATSADGVESMHADPTDEQMGRYAAEGWLGEVEQDYEEVMTRLVAAQAHRQASRILTAREREAFEHCYVEDMSPLEASRHLGVSPQAVWSLRRKAIGKLRRAVA